MEDSGTARAISRDLNKSCFCMTLDRDHLCQTIQDVMGDPAFCREHVVTRPHLYSNVPVFLPASAVMAMQKIVVEIDEISKLPAYRQRVMSWAPAIAQADHGPAGAFMGYDFHLDDQGPRLIEINTNAGGGILNAMLAQAQRACCAEMTESLLLPAPQAFETDLMKMFRAEWRLQRGGKPLQRIAIVDDRPESQYLYPEFLLAQKMFQRSGIEAVIADPQEFQISGGILTLAGRPVDLVYNRLVDFAFEQPEHLVIREAYETGIAVLTPNPHNHALLADKRNLTILSDPEMLEEMGVPAAARDALKAIPKTVLVTPGSADDMWRNRRNLFFKPTRGHGSKAVYRGDKVTRTVWSEIVSGKYVAQEFAAPSERMMKIDGVEERRKMDVRLYTYGRETLLVAARLYQGQTTNFRTPGGGFAPVFAV
jgi:hypothetical protein